MTISEETLFLITLFILCNFCFFSGCVLLAIKNLKKIKKKQTNKEKGQILNLHIPGLEKTCSSFGQIALSFFLPGASSCLPHGRNLIIIIIIIIMVY